MADKVRVPPSVKAKAVEIAAEIVQREGAELAIAGRELDEEAIAAESTLLAAAIATAIIEAYATGYKAALAERKEP
jgi:hypothetical protein